MKIKTLKLKKIKSKNGLLVVAEFKFPIKRVFTVLANKNSKRGYHAHKKCRQLLFCPHGSIKIELFDGYKYKTITLNKSKNAILIPTYIWASQKFLSNNSVLIVLCDKIFSEKEYIRDINNFKKIIDKNK